MKRKAIQEAGHGICVSMSSANLAISEAPVGLHYSIFQQPQRFRGKLRDSSEIILFLIHRMKELPFLVQTKKDVLD